MGLLFLKVLNFEICIYLISFYTCKHFAYIDVHHMCAYVFRVQKRIMNPMELELQMIDSYHIVSGNRTKGSSRASGSLNCRTISSHNPPRLYFSISLST